MKTILSFLITLSFCQLVQAQDMSHTETWQQSHIQLADGSSEYVGGCSLHQDYEGKRFVAGKTLVAYFEPRYEATEAEILAKLKHVDQKLVLAIVTHLDGITHIDDITLDIIRISSAPDLNLYRFNVGVGGGNGMYVVFRKIGNGRSANYKLISDVFDGEVLFCDKSVWR